VFRTRPSSRPMHGFRLPYALRLRFKRVFLAGAAVQRHSARRVAEALGAFAGSRSEENISPDAVAKIEDQRRWVSDFEVVFLAEALRVSVGELLPRHGWRVSRGLYCAA
jgi:hypothetical protein